ncbi:hypothetical protein AMELA_G00201300 [Ameiurus melas]|uniref:Fat storage-inducing transmembrane protein 2 n=1 Tax=Ameiurus melas TaxID=219545 RepID=A0A7J6A720_AMEME|nr:hypothetical protein AMELA_G00201300 [Ameiurus melas]
MSPLSGVVEKSLPVLEFNIRFGRKYLPLFFFALSLGGSLLKELAVVPSSSFSSSGNVLNVYFVKFSWGWNLVLLLPFIFLSNSYGRDFILVSKRLTSLVVATAVWYSCTEIFFYVEDVTGVCYKSDRVAEILEGFDTKAECRNAGHYWECFDISGHSFILSYSTLIIVEEMVPMLYLVQHYQNRTIVLDALYLALNAIAVLWVWMFACTSVYFHDTLQKFLGTLLGVSGWYMTYKVWYLNPFSPGLPPHQTDRKHN